MGDVLVVDFNGTAPTYTFYFAQGLQDQGLRVKVLGAKNNEYLAVHGSSIDYIGETRFPKTVNYILNWIYLLFVAKKYGAIHIQWVPLLNKTSLELLLIDLLQRRNPNLYYTIHNFFPHDSHNIKVHNRYLKLYGLVNNLVVHTDKTEQQLFNKAVPKKVIKIDHGYFYTEFLGKESGYEVKKENTISMLGFIKPYKGVEDAIRAVYLLKSRGNRVKLLIWGRCEPTYFHTLEQLVEYLGVSDCVVLKSGFLPTRQLIETYKESKMTLIPYKKIDQSGVLMTSLGLGVPVVGYRVGGLAEIIRDGKNGYLVASGDVEALAAAIEKCIEKYDEIITNIHSEVKDNTWRKNAAILLNSYRKCKMR